MAKAPYAGYNFSMLRRDFLSSLVGFSLLGRTAPLWAALRSPPVTRFSFGSCAVQDDPQPVWRAIRARDPEFFLFLGDNVYGDTDDMDHLRAQYAKLGAQPEFARFRDSVPVHAIWDDHDYGINDGGREYPAKRESKEIFLEFFREPDESARRVREGIYTSFVVGEAGRRLQVILPDLRWFRDPLLFDPERGYLPHEDPNAQLLGEEQWRWLERELERPADFRVIASSIQVGAVEHQWEKWANFPRERARLLGLLDRFRVDNLLFVSGDMHYGELTEITSPAGRRYFDFTSSGLNYGETADGIPNSRRIELFDRGPNFGCVEIDWEARRCRLTLRDETGVSRFSRSLIF